MIAASSLAAFLATEGIEGSRLESYDDLTGQTLKEGDTPEGKATIAFGLTKYKDGQSVEPGDILDLQEAWDEMFHYLHHEVAPALMRLIKVPLTENQANAYASFLFNFGEGKAKGYTLTRLINSGAGDQALARQWMKYVYAGGKKMLGLHRRRMAEVLLWFGLDWRAALNVSWDDDVFDVMMRLGYEPKADDVEADLFDADYDPTPETPMTTDDLNIRQRWRLQGAIGTKEISINTKLPNEVPYGLGDPREVGLQPKEESRRYQGAVQKEKGAEMENIGRNLTIATGVTGTAVTLSDNVSDLFSTLGQVGLTILSLAALIGVVYWVTGKWRKRRGENLEAEGEIDAVQGMY